MENRIKSFLNMMDHYSDSDYDYDGYSFILNLGNCCFENVSRYIHYKKYNQLKKLNLHLMHDCCFENILSYIKDKNYYYLQTTLNELRKSIK